MRKNSPATKSMISATALVLAIGLSGCGGSSSSDKEGSNPPASSGPNLTEQQTDAIIATMVANPEMVETTSQIGTDIGEMFGGSGHTNSLETRPFSIQKNGSSPSILPLQSGSHSESCPNGGSLTYTYSDTSFDARFNSCRARDSYQGESFEIFLDGRMRLDQESSPTWRTILRNRMENLDARIAYSGPDGNFNIATNLHGDLDLYTDGQHWLDSRIKANTYNTGLTLSCNNQQHGPFQIRIADALIDTRGDGRGYTNEGRYNVAYSGFHHQIDGQYEVTTQAPLHFSSQHASWPYMGETRVNSSQGSWHIKYVEGGVYINENYYSHSDLQDIYDETPEHIRLDGCDNIF